MEGAKVGSRRISGAWGERSKGEGRGTRVARGKCCGLRRNELDPLTDLRVFIVDDDLPIRRKPDIARVHKALEWLHLL